MQQQPQQQTPITNLNHLFQLTQSQNQLTLNHCKVTRNGYDHHFIILGHTWADQSCDRIHFAQNCGIDMVIDGLEEAKRERYSTDDIKADIRNGLRLIQKANYPQGVEGNAIAWNRWLYSEGVTKYITFKNSEHLVSYILTGISRSEPWTLATFTKKAFADAAELFVCEFFVPGVKVLASLIPRWDLGIHNRSFVTDIKRKVNTNSKSWVSWFSRVFNTPKAATPQGYVDRFIKWFCKQYDISLGGVSHPEVLLYDIAVNLVQHCTFIVEQSLKFALFLEMFYIFQMFRLWLGKMKGKIPEPLYKKKMLKRIIGSLFGILGTTVGCLLGFFFSTTNDKTLIFSLLGNIIFHFLASVSSDALIDFVR